jgi:ribonucleotide monophosphatase NagD (HAD superfamily)
LDRLGEGRTLVVGDRVDTDLAAAAAAELDAALVLSGGTKPDALNGFQPHPVAVTETLADLLLS